MSNLILLQLADLIEETTGNDASQVVPESHLEEDLGIVLDSDFGRLVSKINQTFGLHLTANMITDEVETVADLITLIREEQELG